MSAWYLFGVLGLYPVAGQNIYLLSSPRFPEATMTVGDGRVFVIKAPATSIKNKYIVAATLNGKPLNRAWLRHEEIIRGGVLELAMASEPTDWGKAERPPSMAKVAQ
jgi:putative alpha-1,2-mannosidase